MKNKQLSYLILLSLSIFITACNAQPPTLSMEDLIDNALNKAEQQSMILARNVEKIPNALPKSILKNGDLETSDPSWWCSGFFPGTLWYLYEYSGNEEIKDYAQRLTNRLEKEQYNKSTHDLGFMLYCSYGNALRITGTDSCKTILLNGAESLASRYNPTVGCIQSWGKSQKWSFPVIIDNMMNLEFLMWAYNTTQDEKFKNIAISHSDVTMKNQFRPDYSSYHVISYIPETGEVEIKDTHQGLNAESSWARGQAWALYGYQMMYRETKEQRFLDQAIHIADFILNHPNMPEDKIPYWDFDAPEIPNALRDASAASVIASALIEMSRYVDDTKAKEYLSVAEKQLRVLSSPEYTAAQGTNQGFILKHSVGYLLADSEVDVPLTYADYYYIEALLRYKKYILNK